MTSQHKRRNLLPALLLAIGTVFFWILVDVRQLLGFELVETRTKELKAATAADVTYANATVDGLSAGNITTARSRQHESIPQCLLFLHIPKVGGRTVAEFLSSIAISANLLQYKLYNGSPFLLIPELLQPNHTFIAGHFTTRLFELNPAMEQCYTLTVLRDPVDRAISAFFYHGRQYPEDVDPCLNLNGTYPEKSCEHQKQYSNGMIQQLSGIPSPKRKNFRTLLEHSKTNLGKYFDAVCFLDELPSCMERVMKAFGIGPLVQQEFGMKISTLSLNKENKYRTESRPEELDNDTMTKFRDANQLDQELYDFAMSQHTQKTG